MRSRWSKLQRLYWRARGRTRRFEGPFLRMRNTSLSAAAFHSANSPNDKEGSGCPAMVHIGEPWGPVTRIRQFEGPILRMRNARQSNAASHSARFSKRQVGARLSSVNTECGEVRPGKPRVFGVFGFSRPTIVFVYSRFRSKFSSADSTDIQGRS